MNLWKLNREVEGKTLSIFFKSTEEMCEYTKSNPDIGDCSIFHIIPPTILPDTVEIIGWDEVLKNCGATE